MYTTLPDDAPIRDVMHHFRGLRYLQIERTTNSKDDRLKALRVFRDLLFQFKDRFRPHKGYQWHLKFMCETLEQMPPKVNAELGSVRSLRNKEVTKRRWRTLYASARLLGLHSRAVVTANHPSRKRSRNEFDPSSSDDECT